MSVEDDRLGDARRPGVVVRSPLVEVEGVDGSGRPRLFTFGNYQAVRLRTGGVIGHVSTPGFSFAEFEDSPLIAELLTSPGLDEETEQLLLHARHWMVTADDDIVDVIAQEMKFAPLDDPLT